MQEFYITLEERVGGTYKVQAETLEQALEDIKEQYIKGELILTDYPVVNSFAIMGEDREKGEWTEWEEVLF